MNRRGATTFGLLLRVGLVAAVALVVLLLGLPLLGVLFRVSPGVILSRLQEPKVLQALRLSLVASAASTLLVLLLGLPTAYLLASRRFRGKRLVETLIDLPMVLPPTVAGFLLLLAFGRAGLAGRALGVLGISLPFTTLAVVTAQVFMALPFFISPVRAGFASVEHRYLEAASTLRAGEGYTFFRVILPLSVPSVVAGAGMAWARALGEFGATITFAGNLPGVTQTMPLAVYVELQSDIDAAITLSVLLIVMSCVLLLGLRTVPFGPFRHQADVLRDAQ